MKKLVQRCWYKDRKKLQRKSKIFTKFIFNRDVGQTVRVNCFLIWFTGLRVQTLTPFYLAIQTYWKVKNLRHNTCYYSFYVQYWIAIILHCINWIRKRYCVCIIHALTWYICARIKYITNKDSITHALIHKLLWTYMMSFDLEIIDNINNEQNSSIYKNISLPKLNTHMEKFTLMLSGLTLKMSADLSRSYSTYF